MKVNKTGSDLEFMQNSELAMAAEGRTEKVIVAGAVLNRKQISEPIPKGTFVRLWKGACGIGKNALELRPQCEAVS